MVRAAWFTQPDSVSSAREAPISSSSSSRSGRDCDAGGLTYADAGVDIDAGEALVRSIAPLAQSTARPGAEAALGGFGAMFDPKAAGFHDPLLVAATDGVGTKLKIAIETGRHDGVGIDLVAMCVNDLVVQGAEPLFFLDYYASGRLDVESARAVVAGIAEGCRRAGCALVGGETAEMPGLYRAGDYDLAGFAVGAVERDRVLTGQAVSEGDLILGMASEGLHSNGFSLVRRIVEAEGLAWSDPAPFAPDRPLGEALLHPTRIYVPACLHALRTGGVHALAHITGGGLIENIPRVLPKGLCAALDVTALPLPPVFGWLRDAGAVAPLEMARTFNCGVGMVAVVAPERVQAVLGALAEYGEAAGIVGRIEPRPADGPAVRIDRLERVWA